MLRNIAAALIGVLLGAMTVYFVEKLGHGAFPSPAGIDVADVASLRANLARVPLGAKLMVLVSWFAGALAGGVGAILVARRWAPLAFVTGFTIFGLALMSLIAIAAPFWMWPGALAAAAGGSMLAIRITGAQMAPPPRHDPMPGL